MFCLCGCPIDEAVPSTALFLRRVRNGKLVQAIVPVVGVGCDEAMFSPSGDGVLVDIEAGGCFLFGQHSAFPQAVIARAQFVLVGEIGDAQGREAGGVRRGVRPHPDDALVG